MQRRISALAEQTYDLVIVGGGIFGVCAAWEAVRRGLSVALIEKQDFAHATSAHCFKMVHGGLRYLQHGDVIRMRASSHERAALLRMAPHLVRPLPIAIPTYGHGMQGKEVLRLALGLYDLMTWDRNRGVTDPQRRIPRSRCLSRTEALELFPHLQRQGLTGAALVHDGQMYSPPRLALAFLRAAVDAGAVAANYIEATGLLWSQEQVCGVVARDVLNGDSFTITSRFVLNTAGPWAESFFTQQRGAPITPPGTYSRDAYFIVSRRPAQRCALAVLGQTKDPDALISRSRRHLFIAPWRDCMLIGVWHRVHTGTPDNWTLTEEELRQFLDEINESYPGVQLNRAEVAMWNAGLVLFGENEPGSVHLSYGKRSRLVDHQREHGLAGLITLIGVRYTTARHEAIRAVDLVRRKLRRKPFVLFPPLAPVHGGQIECFDDLLSQVLAQRPHALSSECIHSLLQNHGSAYREVLSYLTENPQWGETIGSTTVLKAEVVHAVRQEMAQTLADVVFRRTDLGTAGYPGAEALTACAELMASELGWTATQVQAELNSVQTAFVNYGSLSRECVARQDEPFLRLGAAAS
jgi:glycerol-3-phosphate dehydrogenase